MIIIIIINLRICACMCSTDIVRSVSVYHSLNNFLQIVLVYVYVYSVSAGNRLSVKRLRRSGKENANTRMILGKKKRRKQ